MNAPQTPPPQTPSPGAPVPPLPVGPAFPGGQPGPAEAPGRSGLIARVVLGLLLVGGAGVLVMWPRGQQLEMSFRLTESLAGPKGTFGELKEVPAGESAALRIVVKPGPDAGEEASLVCNAQSRPRVLVSGGRDLVFERKVSAALDAEDEIPVVFTVDEAARPGPREITVEVVAELEAPDQAVVRAAGLRRKITVMIAAPRERPDADGKKP